MERFTVGSQRRKRDLSQGGKLCKRGQNVGSNVRSPRQEARNCLVTNENLIGRVSSHTVDNARKIRVECFWQGATWQIMKRNGFMWCCLLLDQSENGSM